MDKIDLLEFVPNKIKCGKNLREYPLNMKSDEGYIMLSYLTDMITPIRSNAKKEYSLTIPKYINSNQETFKVLGLLQAEMGKTDNACISFSNHEPRLINAVLKWFEKELELPSCKWRWSIKLNINEPLNENYKKEVENKVIDYWTSKTKISPLKNYPKKVTYIKNTRNIILKYYDYGTLVIEHKSNLFSQIIKKYVKIMPHKIPSLEKDEIREFMKGIIAGESNVEIHKLEKRYRVHISAVKKEELDLYQRCLAKLEIFSKQYQDNKLIVSKRKNNTVLLKQRLMCLSPQKYNRFLNMMKLYPKISEETGYFTKSKKSYNKISQDKIDRILGVCRQNPDWPCWRIAKEEEVSPISVARIRKKHDLGKRLTKTQKEIIEKLINLHNQNPSVYAYKIANKLGIHIARVERIRRKYKLARQKQDR